MSHSVGSASSVLKRSARAASASTLAPPTRLTFRSARPIKRCLLYTHRHLSAARPTGDGPAVNNSGGAPKAWFLGEFGSLSSFVFMLLSRLFQMLYFFYYLIIRFGLCFHGLWILGECQKTWLAQMLCFLDPKAMKTSMITEWEHGGEDF